MVHHEIILIIVDQAKVIGVRKVGTWIALHRGITINFLGLEDAGELGVGIDTSSTAVTGPLVIELTKSKVPVRGRSTHELSYVVESPISLLALKETTWPEGGICTSLSGVAGPTQVPSSFVSLRQ